MYPFKDSVNISATILRLHKDFFVLDLFGSCLSAQKISWRDLGKRTGDVEVPENEIL